MYLHAMLLRGTQSGIKRRYFLSLLNNWNSLWRFLTVEALYPLRIVCFTSTELSAGLRCDAGLFRRSVLLLWDPIAWESRGSDLHDSHARVSLSCRIPAETFEININHSQEESESFRWWINTKFTIHSPYWMVCFYFLYHYSHFWMSLDH